MKPAKEETENMNVQMPSWLYREAQLQARAQNITLSQFVRKTLREKLGRANDERV